MGMRMLVWKWEKMGTWDPFPLTSCAVLVNIYNLAGVLRFARAYKNTSRKAHSRRPIAYKIPAIVALLPFHFHLNQLSLSWLRARLNRQLAPASFPVKIIHHVISYHIISEMIDELRVNDHQVCDSLFGSASTVHIYQPRFANGAKRNCNWDYS